MKIWFKNYNTIQYNTIQYSAVVIMYFCRPTHKLVSLWFPQQKPRFFHWLLDYRLWFLSSLFTIIISTNKHNFYEFWRLNTIGRSKKLIIHCKWTTPQSHDFNATTSSDSFSLLKFPKILISNSSEYNCWIRNTSQCVVSGLVTMLLVWRADV